MSKMVQLLNAMNDSYVIPRNDGLKSQARAYRQKALSVLVLYSLWKVA